MGDLQQPHCGLLMLNEKVVQQLHLSVLYRTQSCVTL